MKIAMLLHPSIHLNVDVCGGVERTALAEIQVLNQKGHCVKMWVSGITGTHPNIQVIRDINWRGRYAQWYYYIQFLRTARKFDVLHGHYTPALALLSPEKSVVHFQGLSVVRIPYYRYSYKSAHKAQYVACSQHIAESFRRIYPMIPANHVRAVYNAADLNLFLPGNRSGSDGKANIVYFSLWEEPKGIFDLLNAINILEKRRKDFCLHLIGSALFEGGGKAQEETQNEVLEMSARLSTVKIIGPLSHPQLAEYLKDMDIGVFPSNHREPFGNVVVEMFSAALPVIAFDIGGPREIIDHGKTGLLVKNRDINGLVSSIELLIDNSLLRLEMGRNARERVLQYFNWDRHVEQLIKIYQEIIEAKRK